MNRRKEPSVILLRVKFPFIRTVGPIKSELDVERYTRQRDVSAKSNLLPGSALVLFVYIFRNLFEFLINRFVI